MPAIPKKYRFAVIATDVAIFTILDGKLKVLLIQMKKSPFAGRWAVPGGLLDPAETAEDAARRHLRAKTGIGHAYLEQLYTFSKVDRDPFGRVVSVAYVALVPSEKLALRTTKEYGGVAWFDVSRLPRLAYDHGEIIATALGRLRAKLEYTNIIYSLLPEKFTLTELQTLYELILGRRLDKRNFRRKIETSGLIKRLTHKRREGAHRPAQLFSFRSHKPQMVKLL